MTGGRTEGRNGGTVVALALGAVILVAPADLHAQSWRTITSARQVHGESEATVEVRYGAGRFRLSSGSGSELYRMELRYDEDRFIPLREYDAAAGTLRLGVRQREGQGMNVSFHGRDMDMAAFDLALTRDIPLSLDMELGAVAADVDLGGLALRRVAYRTGASETHLRFSQQNPVACEEMQLEAGAAEFHADKLANANCARIGFRGGVGEVSLDFTGTWRRSATADVNVGIGSLRLRLPDDVGVSVRLNRFLASFDAAGFEKRGSMYYSRNYSGARYKLDLNVNASIGGVEVAWANE